MCAADEVVEQVTAGAEVVVMEVEVAAAAAAEARQLPAPPLQGEQRQRVPKCNVTSGVFTAR
jgi:hypothetical protein